ncbi:MAG: hypothetical protein ACOYON_14340 [Fimbriimonas sp.]
MPTSRIIRNLEARIAKDPNDAEARYLLGRTYFASFCASDPRVIRLYDTEANPHFPSNHTSVSDWQDLKPRTDAATLTNIRLAIKYLSSAVKAGGGEPGLYSLTLACAYEASAPVAKVVDRSATAETFRKLALGAHERAYAGAKAKDRTRGRRSQFGTWENWISVEAAEGVLRLNPRSPLKRDIEEHKGFLEKLPYAPITPIIFNLSRAASLGELLDPSRVVKFDLAGNWSTQFYRWVKPETSFLVWQPDPSQPIRSGRQLFGSATWYLMPGNGYAALSILDDNGDGWLKGAELKGLALWRDANQNGIAEQTEVVSIEWTPIRGLKTTFNRRQGLSYVSDAGLLLANGRSLPTYDWVTQAVQIR